MNGAHLLKHISKNKPAEEFLESKSNKIFTVESFRKFTEWYRDKSKHDKKVGGAKFSERVFSAWIYHEVKNNKKITDISPQKKYPIEIDGIEKDADLFIKSKRNEIIIEFKCNIDMVEKDLFKLMLTPKKYKKILFIWEKHDNSKKAKSDEDSSYVIILKHAKEKKWIDEYFYFPEDVADKELEKRIKEFKSCIQKYIEAT